MDSVEKGIVELITMHGIQKLVMGAAADKLYSKYIRWWVANDYVIFSLSILIEVNVVI